MYGLWKLLILFGSEILIVAIILYQIQKMKDDVTPRWFWFVVGISIIMIIAGILLSLYYVDNEEISTKWTRPIRTEKPIVVKKCETICN